MSCMEDAPWVRVLTSQCSECCPLSPVLLPIAEVTKRLQPPHLWQIAIPKVTRKAGSSHGPDYAIAMSAVELLSHRPATTMLQCAAHCSTSDTPARQLLLPGPDMGRVAQKRLMDLDRLCQIRPLPAKQTMGRTQGACTGVLCCCSMPSLTAGLLAAC